MLVGALAQATTRLRFVTTVYIPAMRNPYSAAKAIGTAALLAAGRVELGVGVLAKLAAKLAEMLNPDGEFSDADRARRRALTLGPQDRDGMSALRGWLTPAARAALEAVLAKLAAPGMANPHDAEPVLDDAPSQEAIERDTRSLAQRQHDALHTAARAPTAPRPRPTPHQALPPPG